MRIAVLAYQEMGAACLETLWTLPQAQVVAVATHRDDPAESRWFRSVGDLARKRGLPVRSPEDANAPEVRAWLKGLEPDFLFSFYFRQVLRPPMLAIPRVAALNLHGSLLPRYRGRAPTNWAVLSGETETGVTLHHMAEKPDAGDVVAQARVEIGPEETAHEVFGKQVAAARDLLHGIWPRLLDGTARRVPQDPAQATVFGRRRPEDGRILWTWSAKRIANLVRAVTHPYPGAFGWLRGRKWFVWSAKAQEAGNGPPGRVLEARPEGIRVSVGDGAVLVRSCQWEGDPERSAPEFARLHRVEEGERLE